MTINMTNNVVGWIASGLFVLLTIVGGWAYSSMDSRLKANEERVDAIMQGISDVRSDVSYIRGRLESQFNRE